MAQIADGNILSDVEREIAASRGQHKGASDGRSPDDIAIDNTLDVLQDRIPVVTGLRKFGILIGSKHDEVGAVDPGEL